MARNPVAAAAAGAAIAVSTSSRRAGVTRSSASTNSTQSPVARPSAASRWAAKLSKARSSTRAPPGARDLAGAIARRAHRPAPGARRRTTSEAQAVAEHALFVAGDDRRGQRRPRGGSLGGNCARPGELPNRRRARRQRRPRRTSDVDHAVVGGPVKAAGSSAGAAPQLGEHRVGLLAWWTPRVVDGARAAG